MNAPFNKTLAQAVFLILVRIDILLGRKVLAVIRIGIRSLSIWLNEPLMLLGQLPIKQVGDLVSLG